MSYSITFFDANRGYNITTKTFSTYEEAFSFMSETFDTINTDLIILN
jgi:hypothetical protein